MRLATKKPVFETYGNVHVFRPGQGQTPPWGKIIFINKNNMSIFLFLTCFSPPVNGIFQIFLIQMHLRPKLTLSLNRSRSSQDRDLLYSFVERYMPSFKIIRLGSGENIFKDFYHIWAWRPYWSCDLDHLYQLYFTLPIVYYKLTL